MKNKFLEKYPKLQIYSPKIGDKVKIIQVQESTGKIIHDANIEEWGYEIGYEGIIVDCGLGIVDIKFFKTNEVMCVLKTEICPVIDHEK